MKNFNRLVTFAKKGFTLVELMVVVAIIGILSAVAIPQFSKYQSKAITTEAKLNLSALYTALESTQAEYDNYATCLNSMGYGAPSKNYYAIGFSQANTARNQAVTANGGACPNTDSHVYSAEKGKGNPAPNVNGVGAATVNTSTFLAAAAGSIANSATNADVWTIDENKELNHATIGY